MVKTVLIIGGSGVVGTHLALRLREQFKVFATYHRHPIRIPGVTGLPLALHNRVWLKQLVSMARPDAIVHLAGSPHARDHGYPYSLSLTEYAGDDAEGQALEQIHAESAVNVLVAAEVMQPRFIYLSNAFVFDGMRGNYHEAETAIPVSALGKAKLSAENFVRSRSMSSIIVRSSPLIGRGNGLNFSFLDYLRMSLERGKRIEASEREVHSFAPVSGLTELISELITRPAQKARVLHYGGLTKLSLAELARTVARRFGYDPKLVVASVQGSAARGRDAVYDYSLNSSQAVELLKVKPLLLEESLDLVQEKLVSGL